MTSTAFAYGTVVQSHGPVASLNWPPMTMKFLARMRPCGASWAKAKQGDVELAQDGKDCVVTKVK
ncbi:Copper binding periplasmic protein CusF [Xylophilus ampelinus]|nr:Copper binding periplasmic protein CusF [Xylophilus ampelinus]